MLGAFALISHKVAHMTEIGMLRFPSPTLALMQTTAIHGEIEEMCIHSK